MMLDETASHRSRWMAGFLLFVSIVCVPTAVQGQGSGDPPRVVLERSDQVWPTTERTWHTAFGDLDGDGDLDGVLASLGPPSILLLNDGRGGFTVSDQTFPGSMHWIEMGDLDGDGDLDLFFAPLRGQAQPVYLNDGRARFQVSGPIVERSEIVRLMDVENDGDLDAYLLYASVIYLNDGHGDFHRRADPVPAPAYFSDLNGDGFVDLLQGAWGEGFRVYLNDRTGRFEEYSFLPKRGLTAGSVALADLDNDGDVDAVYTDGTDEEEHPSGVLLNDGTGRFRDSGQRLSPAPYGNVGVGDLNGDGFTDVVLQGRSVPAQVWVNNGDGELRDTGIRLGDGSSGWNNCAVADLDGDGDLDIFLTDTLGSQHGLWINQLHEGVR